MEQVETARDDVCLTSIDGTVGLYWFPASNFLERVHDLLLERDLLPIQSNAVLMAG